ncbi:MAG: pseudouridine synthase [Hydrogenophaga sp.]|uniref:pseudouridine synthase n=1 Tax=Hydrogenophaga sp. TaxID=1904254 RepID=UPI00271562BE|nr:pseudouridine synthase [Hydrogenophaga sp.]MDO9479338.1 pseudouridine synthase [Hydrogenophaga sp.]MDP3346108.1 pseudouridine synthase [Hydrogenophaga sp.]MDP3806929.1 pseudouridine synthase [Hydrogenophaga sp.]MDP3927052.1 pseudouridine synthase [Hydrogenophaga sp.]
MSRPPRQPHIPTRHGVSASCVALPTVKPGASPWASVLDFLDHRLPLVGRAVWSLRLANGDVLDENAQALAPDAPYRGGSRLYYYRALDNEVEVPFQATVLYQDAHLVVADKPHFLPVTPGGRYVQQSLLVRLKHSLGLDSLSPIHRIDRETAGLVLFAVRAQDRAAYQALFRERSVHKVYEAMAPFDANVPLPQVRRSRIAEEDGAFFRMTEVTGEPNSETRIELLEQRGAWARYRLEPVSGKRHQLRVHMNALGLPLVGDQFYPRVLRGPDEAEDFANPLRLLAQAIAFTDPVTGEARRFESGLQLDWPNPAA